MKITTVQSYHKCFKRELCGLMVWTCLGLLDTSGNETLHVEFYLDWMSYNMDEWSRHVSPHNLTFLMDSQRRFKNESIFWCMTAQISWTRKPPWYVRELINKINQIFGFPHSYQRVSCLDTVRHMGQKFSKQFIGQSSVCEKTLILLFLLFICLYSCSGFDKAGEWCLMQHFPRVIVRYHWGTDKYESNRV